MDVNFIASVAAAEDLEPIHISPARGNNSNSNSASAPATGPLFLVPPTPPPPSAYLARFAGRTPASHSPHVAENPASASASTGNANNGNGNIYLNNESHPPQPTLIVNDMPPPTRRSLHNLFDSQSPMTVPLVPLSTTSGANENNFNVNINNNSDTNPNMNLNNNAAQELISFPLHFHSREHDDVNHGHSRTLAAMEESSFRIPSTASASVVPVVNVRHSRPRGPTSRTQPPQRATMHSEQQQQQIHQQLMFLEPNSATTTPSAHAQMPLFSHESNPSLNTTSTTTPNPINTEVNPNNIAILPPINININNPVRYPSSTPAVAPPHLPYTSAGVPALNSIPLITSIPSNPNPSRSHTNTIIPGENRKRKRVDTPAVSAVAVAKKEKDAKVDADTEDDNCCSICLEPWNPTGPHQLCCLPCGHLFGRSCIDQWLKKKKTPSVCPNCKQNMKGRKATLIFGAPHRLVTVDQGEIENVKAELAKEREAHERTKKRLKDSKDHNVNLKNRLRQFNSLQVLGAGRADAGQSATHHVVQQHPTRIPHATRASLTATERRSALMNAVRSVHERRIIEDSPTPGFALPRPMTIRTNRANSLLDVAARLGPNLMPARTSIANRGNGNGNTGAATGGASASRMEVALMFEIRTNGGSRALAFDDTGHVIYNERHRNPNMNMNSRVSATALSLSAAENNNNNMVQKICRRPIVGNGAGGVTSRCRAEIMGRVNSICANTHAGNAYRGYISVCVQSKKVLILNRALEEVVSYSVPHVPMCSWWVGSSLESNNGHVLLVGLLDGHIMAFDMRNTSLGPMAQRRLPANGGPPAVHSISQVGTNGTILAATPTRILKVTFGQFAGTINLHPIHAVPAGELCSSLAVHGRRVLVSTRENNLQGKHAIYDGLSPDNNGLGPVLMGGLAGHKMGGLFEQAAILSTNNDYNIGPLVFAPDTADAVRYTRYWQRDPDTSEWTSARIAPYAFSGNAGVSQPPVVRALALPNPHSSAAGSRLRIGNDPMVGMVAHLSDNSLQIFSVVRR